MLETAKKYLDLGYNVIPIGKDKKSLVKWEPYQKEKVTSKQLEEWFKQFKQPNIGIVTGSISNLFVIDTDTPEATQKIQDYIPENIITPIQSTPREGRHFFFKHIEGFSNRARVLPGVDIRTQGGYIVVSPSQNGEGKHWQWLDGLSLLDISPAPLPDALLSFIKEFAFVLYKGITEKAEERYKALQNGKGFFEYGVRDETLFHIANAMVKNRCDGGLIWEVLERLILSWGENPDPKWIEAKIKSALNRAERKERNLSQEIEQWVALQDRYFSVTNCYNELFIVTKEDKNCARQVFFRLKGDEIIEKYGDREGFYRTVEKGADEIDFMGTEEKVIGIHWPFEIEKWVKILPKNIIVVAGESNAGKTAFLLNTCWLNMGKFKINYFSSEMGAMELRARLQKFEGNLKHWKENINFRERSSNFADIIKPNEVNIVDFLEVTGGPGNEFFLVGGMIKQIYDRLKKGIAIIAIQKPKGRDLGLGNERSIEKARLYLSIEHGKIKIIKGKNWTNSEINPNGMGWKFKLVQGAKFIIVSEEERQRKDW